MINLLPPEEKSKLLSEKRKKLTIILGLIVVIPLLCLILILLSIKLYILGEINSQQLILEQAMKEYQTPDFLSFKEIIQENDKILTSIKSFYKKEIYFTEALKIISSLSRPENLYLTSVALKQSEDKKIKATVSGFSKSRDGLLLFQKAINENTQIQNVNFSPESWVNPQDVKFSLTFEIK